MVKVGAGVEARAGANVMQTQGWQGWLVAVRSRVLFGSETMPPAPI